MYPTVASGDSGIHSDENRREHWGSPTVTTGDSGSGDSGNEADQARAEALFDRNLDLANGEPDRGPVRTGRRETHPAGVIECPVCHAPPGDKCQKGDGSLYQVTWTSIRRTPHKARIEAFEAGEDR